MLHSLCVSSCTRRACHSGRAFVQLPLMAAFTPARSLVPWAGPTRASPPPNAITVAIPTVTPLVRMVPPLPLDLGRADFAALGSVHEVHGERHRHIRAVVHKRQAHLPEAVGDAVLHGHHRALRDTIGGPLPDHLARLFRLA